MTMNRRHDGEEKLDNNDEYKRDDTKMLAGDDHVKGGR